MKRVLIMVVVMAVSILFAPAFLSEARHIPSPAGKSPRAFVGDVVSVDTTAKILVARSKTREMTFDVSSAQYANGTKLEKLKRGDRVSVEYMGKYGKYSAVLVAKVRTRPGK